ncbi:hypothetical protein BC830DRAFT_677147 [Chytriomyces sp. MP71]|nr:hypothetical protein BC830DRAFT_677147 [Chytriomyces sp. MP71]
MPQSPQFRRKRLVALMFILCALALFLGGSRAGVRTVSRSRQRATTTIAVALKSGFETANTRAVAQIDTFLDGRVSVLAVGERQKLVRNMEKNTSFQLVDVYSNAFRDARQRLREKGFTVELGNRVGWGNKVLPPSSDSAAKLVRRMEQGHNANDTSQSGWFDNEGWRVDAHKNLPAFKLLHQTFPEADWFMMIDDDTYVFIDSLKKYLSKFDPSKPYYFGQANRFRGCDGVMEFAEAEKAPLVAQGGAGILLSRGAMRAMADVLDACIVRYEDCWAGDIRVALCLRDANIRLKHTAGFNGWPPQGNFVFTPNPCEIPFTYHHVLPDQMFILREIERDYTSRHLGAPIPSAEVFRRFQRLAQTNDLDEHIRETGFERKGRPFMNFKVNKAEECEDRCLYYRECVSWYYSADSRCWLKRTPGGKEEMEGAISGVFPNRFQCQRSGWWPFG